MESFQLKCSQNFAPLKCILVNVRKTKLQLKAQAIK